MVEDLEFDNYYAIHAARADLLGGSNVAVRPASPMNVWLRWRPPRLNERF